MNKVEAEKQFKESYLTEEFKKMDKYAQRLEWDMYVDHLCKAGEISQNQYHNWMRPKFIK